jgi:transcriptional regulator with XRE-family HTH domain
LKAKDPEKARVIGARLVELRNAAGMKQREVADVVGVSERSIQAYEQGETIPWRFGSQFAELFNTSVAYIWYGQDGLSGNSDNLLQILLTEVRSLRSYVEVEMVEVRESLAASRNEVGRLARAEVGRLEDDRPTD